VSVHHIPDGYATVTPYLVVPDVLLQLDFVQRAFGAVETLRLPGPDGRITHAEARVGNSTIMMGTPLGETLKSQIHLYVEDVDAVFTAALAAGATVVRDVANQFYGDRSGQVQDPNGNFWFIATHVEDVSPDEMHRRMVALAAAHDEQNNGDRKNDEPKNGEAAEQPESGARQSEPART
jgi:PhnB protein